MECGIVWRALQRPMERHQGIGRKYRPSPRIALLQPGAYQHQVCRACRQQGDGQRDMHSLARCFEGRCHDGKTSGDSSPGVSRFIFRRIQDSFTTQGLPPKRPESGDLRPHFCVNRPQPG